MKRSDGRAPDELRPIRIEAGVLKNAHGSALVQMGKTTALAGVYGPRMLHPRRLQTSEKAYLRPVYSMIPFSTTERVRPGPSRRTMEICKVIRCALEPVIFVEEFPKTAIDIFINILQADAGTRTAAINAASVALADAGIPMRDLVASVAAGKIGSNYVLDLTGEEEDMTEADLPIAYVPRQKKITLMQMDGNLAAEDVKKTLNLAIKGTERIYELQKEALRKRWKI